MGKARILFGAFVLALMLACCSWYDHEIKIGDLQHEKIIVLRKEPQRGDVYSINIRVRGKILGEAKMHLMLNGKPYKTELLKGAVRFNWGGDWYSDTADIKFEPMKIEYGELFIEYRFNTSD